MGIIDAIKEKNLQRHLKRCAEGKHKWYVSSAEASEYDYCSYGGPGPEYSETVYKCFYCDAIDIVTSGEKPDGYDEEE